MTTSRGWNGREDLLKEAAKKPIRTLLQVDGWYLKDGGDSVMEPDKDGDWLSSTITEEFRRAGKDLVVRVHVHPQANPKVVQRLLRKMAKDLTWAFHSITEHALSIIAKERLPNDTPDSTEREEGHGR